MKAPPTPRLPPSTNKRLRTSDEYDIGNGGGGLDAKRTRLDNGSNNSSPVIQPPLVQNGLDRSQRDGREIGSDNHAMISTPTTPLTSSKKGSKLESDVLKAQISRAQRAGKVKTTKELIENLGINSGGLAADAVTSAAAGGNVTSLVPDENKEQLMNRFFSSQSQPPVAAPAATTVIDDDEEITVIARDEEEDDVIEVLSRPGTGVGSRSRNSELKSHSNSQVSSRINTPAVTPTPFLHTSAAAAQQPPKQTVEDILSQLEPFDAEAVLAEWEEKLGHEEEDDDIPGLIPVYKPKLEITEAVVEELNSGALEYIGGVKDHTGQFKEWHEMVSLDRLVPDDKKENGELELLHILPYSVID